MKCANCSDIIKSCRDCIFCGNKCCCFICLEAHYLSEHKKKNNSSKSKDKNKEQISNNNEEKIENKKISPYLVSGIINKKINYDKKYSLENFTPIMDGDEIKAIGSGSFGQVYLAVNNIDNKKYAIKHMDKKKLIKILHSLKGIYQEIDIQSKIDHPNIVKILFTDEDEDSFDLVMEYADNGSLFHYIRKNKGLNEFKTFQLFIQVVNAINFLHENDLIHRDIKPENILLFKNHDKSNGNGSDFIVKLCDFGWCVKLNGHERETFCGTTEYMSPELVEHKEYSKEIDVWSLGILLYEMIHGYSPFRPNKLKFKEKDVFDNIKKHKLKFGKKVSDECKRLIYHLLAFDKNNRYKVGDIYNSKFVRYFEKINYCIPKEKIKEVTNKEKNEEEVKDDDDKNINKNDEVKNNNKNNNNNNFIYREINDEEKNEKKDNNPINEVYNEIKQLNKQNLRKILTNNNIDNNIIKSLSKVNNKENIYTGIRNKYSLSMVNNKNEKNNSISFINKKTNNINQIKNKRSISNISENELVDKLKKKRNYSLQNENIYHYNIPNMLNNKNLKKNRTLSKIFGRSLSKDNKHIFNKKIFNINKKTKNCNCNFDIKKEKNSNIVKINYRKNNTIINKERNNKNKNNQIFINKNDNSNNKKLVNRKNIQNNKKERKYNNLHPIEINGKIPLNFEKYNIKKQDIPSSYIAKYNINNKNNSQRLKTNTNISTTNNSINNKIKKDNSPENKEKKKNNSINNKILSKEKEKEMEKNKINKKKNIKEYADLKLQKENNSKIVLKKKNSINNIKKIYNTKQTNIYKDSNINTNNNEMSNNENINHDTLLLELSPECLIHQKIKNDSEKIKIKTKANFNYRKSPDLKNPKCIFASTKLNNELSYNRKNKIQNIKNNININGDLGSKGKRIMKYKNINSTSPKFINNINCYKNKNISKQNSKSRSSKINKYKDGKRKINSVNNKNNNKIKDKLELSRINSERIIIKHKDNNHNHSINNKSFKKNILTPPIRNFIFIKTQKIDNNNIKNEIKQIKSISPEKYFNLLRNNTTKNIIKISPPQKIISENYGKIEKIKLKNKKSFCFISRNNNKIAQNKYENIYCGNPINKINNINYQNNNINNFYIINGSLGNINQKLLKKQFTNEQKEIKKNIDYSKLILPLSVFEKECINHTFNKSKNKIQNTNKDLTNIKSLNKNKAKVNLKYYIMKIKNKRVHSYNNKRYVKNKDKTTSKDTDSNIIYGDSEFSDEGERNPTPKKNKDNVKINPIKLLGDFKKEYTIFNNNNNKNLSEYSGIKQ